MAWMWWLLAPVASTGLGAVVIWWRTPVQTGRRLRRMDAMSEHQALLRALERRSPALSPPALSPPALPRADMRVLAAEQGAD